MTQFIAQATQPSGFASWSSAEWVTVLGAITAAVVAIITAFRAGNKATEAKATADTNSGELTGLQQSLNRHADRVEKVNDRVTNLALSAQPILPAAPPTETK
jgi:hypothetical protein